MRRSGGGRLRCCRRRSPRRAAAGTSTTRGSAQPQGADLRITLGTQNFTEAICWASCGARRWRRTATRSTCARDIGPAGGARRGDARRRDRRAPGLHRASLSVVAGEESAGLDAEQTYRQLKALYAKRGQTLSAMTPYENVDAIATTRLFAQRERLRTMADLRRLDSFTLGARPEFEEPLPGARRDCSRSTASPTRVRARRARRPVRRARRGRRRRGNVFTTDPQLAERRLRRARGSRAPVRLPARGRWSSTRRSSTASARGVPRRGRRRQPPADDRVDRRDERGGEPDGQDEARWRRASCARPGC